MNVTRTRAKGWLLILLGVLVMVLSPKIVFPGFERLLGIETIVGKENVVYHNGGGYIFTNPSAIIRWELTVTVIGLLIFLLGVFQIFSIQKFQRMNQEKK